MGQKYIQSLGKSILIDLALDGLMFLDTQCQDIGKFTKHLLTKFNENHKVNLDHICC